MSVFYLIRHAHAKWTPDEQRSLTSKGQKDARRIAELLCVLPITRIYSSPYQRARQTVVPLASRLGLPVLIEHDLREKKLGDAPGVYDFNTSVRKTWQDPVFHYTGGETNAAAKLRAVVVLTRLQKHYPGEHIALSMHGNLTTLVLQHYDPCIDYAFWSALTMPDIYVLNLMHTEIPVIRRLWKE